MIAVSSAMRRHPVFVLDSWPSLELLRKHEPASTQFRSLLRDAMQDDSELQISRINLGEVYYKAVHYRGERTAQAFLQGVQSNVHVISADDALVDAAALLKSRFAMSYADCFAAALAIRVNGPVVTGDPDFHQLKVAGIIDLVWLGA